MNATSRDNLDALPAGIEELIPEIEDGFRELDQAGRKLSARANGVQWQIGLRLVGALGGISHDRRMPTLKAIALRVARSLPHVYNLVNVAEAWPHDLPERPWSALAKLARHPEAERERLNAELPLDTPASKIPGVRTTGPGANADRREAKAGDRLLGSARDAIRALPGRSKLPLLIETLRAISPSDLSDCRRPERQVDKICQAAFALKDLLAESDHEQSAAH